MPQLPMADKPGNAHPYQEPFVSLIHFLHHTSLPGACPRHPSPSSGHSRAPQQHARARALAELKDVLLAVDDAQRAGRRELPDVPAVEPPPRRPAPPPSCPAPGACMCNGIDGKFNSLTVMMCMGGTYKVTSTQEPRMNESMNEWHLCSRQGC